MTAAVILAAGLGARFLSAGIDVPKPLIRYKTVPLLYHAMGAATSWCFARLIIVGTPAVKYSMGAGISDVTFVDVTVTQPGPVASALLALAHLEPREPVVFFDCDNVYGAEAYEFKLPIGRNFMVTTMLPAPDNNFCCVVKHKDGFSVKEKTGESCEVGVGIYGFATADVFRYNAYKQLANGHLAGIARDMPMSAVMNELISMETLQIPRDSWVPVGTPAQLARAESEL